MLARKQMSKEKLIACVSIIFLMVVGSVFMLYQNKKLTSRKTVNIPVPFNYQPPALIAPEPMKDAAEDNAIQNKKKAESAAPNGALDLKIFSSDKFKSLKQNAQAAKDPAAIGKKDPFKPN